MNIKRIALAASCLLVQLHLFAQSDSSAWNANPALKLDWPLFDLPYQVAAMDTVGHGFFSSYANPSMAQSLALSQSVYSSFHYGMKYFYDSNGFGMLTNVIYYGGTALGNYVFGWMPGGDGWLHEEYHRAVMSRFGVNSFNDMNLFPIGASTIYVSKVNDSDLIRMKKENPYDFVRMHVAGIEGQYLLINNLQRDNFFYNQNLLNEIVYWLTTLNSHLYVLTSPSSENDAQTKTMNEKETDMASRDFTGFDFNAWVYDLFKPHEPYEDRGAHPSGVGINRYRNSSDLTDEELKYLKLHGNLQMLNYLSPMMFGIRTIPLGNSGFEGNFAIRHYLTSFGADIAANVFLKIKPFNMAFALHNYVNYRNYFPAIEAELVDYQVYIGKLGLYVSPRILIGMQPKDQVFKTGSPEFLGLFGLRIDFMASMHFLPYLDFTAKTDGWVAGNEYLSANASVRLGVSMRF